MKRLRIQWIFAVFLTIISSSIHASTNLNGSSGYQDLGNDVFVASLYLETPNNSADSILATNEEMKLQVVLTNRMSKRRWVNMWMQSMAINNPRDSFETQANNLVDLFDTFKGALIANDTFEIHYLPSVGTTVSLNSVALSQQPGKDLLLVFLRAWIGSVPPSTQFKAQILGQEDSSSIAASVVGLSPSQQRIEAVTQWTITEEEKLAEEKRLKEEQEAKEKEAKEKELLAQQAAAEEKAKAEAEAAKARAEAEAAQAEIAKAEKPLLRQKPKLKLKLKKMSSYLLNLYLLSKNIQLMLPEKSIAKFAIPKMQLNATNKVQ